MRLLPSCVFWVVVFELSTGVFCLLVCFLVRGLLVCAGVVLFWFALCGLFTVYFCASLRLWLFTCGLWILGGCAFGFC